MKQKQILSMALVALSVNSFAVSWSQLGDDGNPNTQGNGAYTKHEASSTPKVITKKSLKKSTSTPSALAAASVRGLFQTEARTTLCIKDEANKPHTLEAANVSSAGWPNSEFSPAKVFVNTKVRAGRTTCRSLIIGGNAQFDLVVDGIAVPMQILSRYNNIVSDPSDISYVWAAKTGGPLVGTKWLTDGYASGIFNGDTTFKITK